MLAHELFYESLEAGQTGRAVEDAARLGAGAALMKGGFDLLARAMPGPISMRVQRVLDPIVNAQSSREHHELKMELQLRRRSRESLSQSGSDATYDFGEPWHAGEAPAKDRQGGDLRAPEMPPLPPECP